MIPFPDKKYKVIYADPPWSYRNKNTGGSMKSGSANQYPTMTLDEVRNLPVENISDKDCVLFLWVTTPLLPEGIDVLKGWGFKYKTALYWDKMSFGMGFWFRGQVEVLLMGVKGNVKAFRLPKPNFVQAKSKRHSKKPEEFRELIELTGLNPKIELFARKRTEGWDVWGDEV